MTNEWVSTRMEAVISGLLSFKLEIRTRQDLAVTTCRDTDNLTNDNIAIFQRIRIA